MNKVYEDVDLAVADIPDRATIMLGGFGLCGIPETLINAVLRQGATGLHTISNNMGVDKAGLGLLLEANRIASHVGSYVGENKLLEKRVLDGSLDLTLIPQGTLAERIRAGGAGIPAFFCPTGAGTAVADGKEVRIFGSKTCILETALHADFALIRAWRADIYGNLQFRMSAQNFNPVMATAARCTIVEAEEITAVPLAPSSIHSPGIFVHRIVPVSTSPKLIERRTTRRSIDR